jgi:hypothetical protein
MDVWLAAGAGQQGRHASHTHKLHTAARRTPGCWGRVLQHTTSCAVSHADTHTERARATTRGGCVRRHPAHNAACADPSGVTVCQCLCFNSRGLTTQGQALGLPALRPHERSKGQAATRLPACSCCLQAAGVTTAKPDCPAHCATDQHAPAGVAGAGTVHAGTHHAQHQQPQTHHHCQPMSVPHLSVPPKMYSCQPDSTAQTLRLPAGQGWAANESSHTPCRRVGHTRAAADP